MTDVKTTNKALTERMAKAEGYLRMASELRTSSETLLKTLKKLERSKYRENTVQYFAWAEYGDEWYQPNINLIGKDEIDLFKQFLNDLLEMKNKKMQSVLKRIEGGTK